MDLKTACEIFQIPADSSDEEIKKQYKLLAKKYHPDKGGSVEQMQNLNTACNIMLERKDKNIQNHFADMAESNVGKKTTNFGYDILNISHLILHKESLRNDRFKIKFVEKTRHVNALEHDFFEYIKEERMIENKLNSGIVGMLNSFGCSNITVEIATITFYDFKHIFKRKIDPLSIKLTCCFLKIIVPMRKLNEDFDLIDEDIFILYTEYYECREVSNKQECINVFLDNRYNCEYKTKINRINDIKFSEEYFNKNTNMIDLEEAFDTELEDRTDDQYYMVYNYTILKKCKSYIDLMI